MILLNLTLQTSTVLQLVLLAKLEIQEIYTRRVHIKAGGKMYKLSDSKGCDQWQKFKWQLIYYWCTSEINTGGNTN